MKKHIAAIAAAILTICSFTACDKKDSGGNTTEPQTSQSAETVSFDKDEAEKKVTDVINDYFSAINSGDMEKVFEFQYSKDDLEAAAVMSGFGTEGGTAAEARENMINAYKDGYSGHVITLKAVTSVKPVSQKCYELLDEMYGRVIAVKGLTAKYGGDSGLDIQKITEEYGAMTDFSGGKQEYEEAYDVVTDITFDETNKEQEMIVFRTKDGGWKIDMTVVNYLQEVEQTDLDNAASKVAGAVSEALLKLKNEGTDISGRYILASDESRNYLVPDGFDLKKFKEYFNDIYSGDANVQYFFVISDDKAVGGAYIDAEGKLGLYPVGFIVKDNGEGGITYEEPDSTQEYTFDQVYDISKNVLDGLNK